MKKTLILVLAIMLTLMTSLSFLAVPAAAGAGDWYENWDSYASWQNMHGVNDWKGWDNDPGLTAYTSRSTYITSPNSIAIGKNSDLVHEFSGYNSGRWRFTAWQYIPNNFTGDAWFILLNTYKDGGNEAYNIWSTQVVCDGSSGTVYDSYNGGELPLIKGQWVEIRVDIDLDNNWQYVYYQGDLLFSYEWSDELEPGEDPNIGAVDLYVEESSAPYYYDNLSLVSIDGFESLLLLPAVNSSTVNTEHTVTVLAETIRPKKQVSEEISKGIYAVPITGESVTFTITSGPHAGLSGKAITGPDGKAQWSYTGTDKGADVIVATTEANEYAAMTSNVSYQHWVKPLGMGGEVAGVNKPGLFLPWLVLAGAIMVGCIGLVLYRRKAS